MLIIIVDSFYNAAITIFVCFKINPTGSKSLRARHGQTTPLNATKQFFPS
jgi:hypothetical protein